MARHRERETVITDSLLDLYGLLALAVECEFPRCQKALRTEITLLTELLEAYDARRERQSVRRISRD